MAAPEKYRKMFGKERADKIMKRGMGAFFQAGSRPGQTAYSWGVARLKAHAKGKATVRKADADLVKPKKKG